MVGVISIRPFRLQNDVVRPDVAPVSAKDAQVRLTCSWDVILRNNQTSGGGPRWPRPQLERNLIRGSRAANRSQVFGQRLDVFLLPERTCTGDFRLCGSFPCY